MQQDDRKTVGHRKARQCNRIPASAYRNANAPGVPQPRVAFDEIIESPKQILNLPLILAQLNFALT